MTHYSSQPEGVMSHLVYNSMYVQVGHMNVQVGHMNVQVGHTNVHVGHTNVQVGHMYICSTMLVLILIFEWRRFHIP